MSGGQLALAVLQKPPGTALLAPLLAQAVQSGSHDGTERVTFERVLRAGSSLVTIGAGLAWALVNSEHEHRVDPILVRSMINSGAEPRAGKK